uniref:Innexin n=1 Tax=Heterorhabditis bacteriophora TaxID=37862 RepID=A0A1I7WNZ2_HETBA
MDRINYKYTSYLFVFGTLIISYKQYLGSAITCWTPAEFRGGWDEYTRDYCLIENTYYVPLNDPNLPNVQYREKEELPYYQVNDSNLILPPSNFHVFVSHFPKVYPLALNLGFNTDWKTTGLFPRSTMCDFEIRNKGNVQRYSVQCVLSLNMFNEKIFLILFYWLMILFAATVINLGLWLVNIYSYRERSSFAQRMLESAGVAKSLLIEQKSTKNQRYKKRDRNKLSASALNITINTPIIFIKDGTEMKSLIGDEARSRQDMANTYNEFVALHPDLVVLLRLISSCAGVSVTSDITKALLNKV